MPVLTHPQVLFLIIWNHITRNPDPTNVTCHKVHYVTKCCRFLILVDSFCLWLKKVDRFYWLFWHTFLNKLTFILIRLSYSYRKLTQLNLFLIFVDHHLLFLHSIDSRMKIGWWCLALCYWLYWTMLNNFIIKFFHHFSRMVDLRHLRHLREK